MRSLCKYAFLAMCFIAGGLSAATVNAQSGIISGIVSEESSAVALVGANVLLIPVDGNSAQFGTATDIKGRYSFSQLKAGTYSLRFSYVGFGTVTLESIVVAVNAEIVKNVELSPSPFEIGTVTVESASRKSERFLEAPVSLDIIDASEIAARPAVSVAEHLQSAKGVDVIMTGVATTNVTTRGFNSMFETLLYPLVDNRITRLPSLRVNQLHRLPMVDSDLERIEVILGPGSALYGPNVTNGVIHFITKSAFEYPGTTLSVIGGQQQVLSGAFRHAARLTDKLAFKVTGQVLNGEDWKYSDSNEPLRVVRGVRTPDGFEAEGPEQSNARDYDFSQKRFLANLEYRPNQDTKIVMQGTYSEEDDIIPSPVGAAQVYGASYSSFQARMTHKNLFVQSYVNHFNTGKTYDLRSGIRDIDESYLYVTQIQHQLTLIDGKQHFVYGADLLLTRPETKGTIHGRNENDDNINEVGIYIQSETALTDRLRLVLAARVDDHSRLTDMVFSPRVGVVFEATPASTFRATYNRAYRNPSAFELFMDQLQGSSLGGLPFAYRLKGTGEDGFHFTRNPSSGGIGGLMMQSPFTPEAFGGASLVIPADATLAWGAVVGILGAQGIDISLLPAPSQSVVGTDLKTLDIGTGQFVEVLPSSVRDTPAMKPGLQDMLEVGYSGLLNDRWLFTIDTWSKSMNRVNSLGTLTPNVFLNAADLTTYLGNFLPAPNAAGLAQIIGQIPLGTVTPNETAVSDPSDLIITAVNVEGITVYGVNTSLGYYGKNWTADATYSILDKNVFKGSEERPFEYYLNAPKHKLSAKFEYRSVSSGLSGGVRARYSSEFKAGSGVHVGVVPSSVVMDLRASYQLPIEANVTATLSIQNLLDDMHQEFPGLPEIGRLSMLRIEYSF